MRIVYALVIFTLFSSCGSKKKNNELYSCQDNALAEIFYLDVYKQVQIYVGAYLSKKTPSDAGITLTSNVNQNSITYPFNLTIDYGTADHLCSDSKYRRGLLKVAVYGNTGDTSLLDITKAIVTFDSYYMNQTKAIGTYTITNNGLNTDGLPYFFLSVVSGNIINANGTMTWNSSKYLTMNAGKDTKNIITDDSYTLLGNGSGKDFKGTDFSANISADCVVDPNCKYYIKSGTMSIEPYNLDVRNLNYGSGTCTGQIQVQIGESSFYFSMQ